jgi:GAF domain-containing protein
LVEAQDHQTATSEILKVISHSPSDVQPVFDMIAESAARLCDAIDGTIFQVDSNVLRVVVHRGPIPSASVGQTRPMVRETPTGRAVLDRRTIHVADVQAEVDEYPEGSVRARRLGYRTILAAPLLHVGEAIGAIVVRRTEMRPFTEWQVALLQTFADQAVIAIENVRLFNETKEALDQQTATIEILRVISSSPTDIQPVLDAIAESAARLCEASDVLIRRVDGDMMRVVAHIGSVPIVESVIAQPISRGSAGGRAILECRTVHIHDVLNPDVGEEYPIGLWNLFPDVPYRTLLVVPLVREDTAIGTIAIRRPEVRPFSDKQVELLQTFADQAVIAIENVRLFNETKEALERQTATAEILKVISSSPTNIQPVLDVMAESAARLCEAADASIFRVDADRIRLVAQHGAMPHGPVGEWTLPLVRQGVAGRSVIDARTVHLADVLAEADEFPVTIPNARRVGFRTMLSVPLVRDGVGIGAIQVLRREPRLFSERQVALLETFADQAVIAIENVRLFKELQQKNQDLTQAHAQVSESLEQQTATSEILQVISRSPTDVQPVFDSLVASAARLCGANDVLLLIRDGDVLRPAAGVGSFLESLEADFRVPLGRGTVAARSVIDGATLHIPDLAALSEADFPIGRDLQRRFGHRTVLAVPLVREGVALGTIFAMRFEVKAFADQQIALLKTFADQAVIAIENVRLFKELETRNAELTETIARQTATGEVLRAISQAQTDAQPVFEIIARSARRLCEAAYGQVQLYDGELIHLAAVEMAIQRATSLSRRCTRCELETAVPEAGRSRRVRSYRFRICSTIGRTRSRGRGKLVAYGVCWPCRC